MRTKIAGNVAPFCLNPRYRYWFSTANIVARICVVAWMCIGYKAQMSKRRQGSINLRLNGVTLQRPVCEVLIENTREGRGAQTIQPVFGIGRKPGSSTGAIFTWILVTSRVPHGMTDRCVNIVWMMFLRLTGSGREHRRQKRGWAPKQVLHFRVKRYWPNSGLHSGLTTLSI